MGALSIRNVTKSFGKQAVLKGIDIEVDEGQFLILVGPSGCGKSTLLNMIAGLDTVTGGDIVIGDQRVNDLSPKDRDIAMVFQSYALYPNMNVRQNIAFGLEIRKVPQAEQEETIQRVADILQIGPLLDRKPAQLSGGQRQRVAMGRALSRNPALFLFDEPLSNLDAKLRVEMRTEIKRLHQRTGTTIVYVTHDQIEAMTLGDRIAVMRDGEVRQFGSPRDIYDDPADMYVAGFIGSPSMNFIPCQVSEVGSGVGVNLDTGEEHYFLALAEAESRLKPYLGQQLILGIRPEQISVPGDNAAQTEPLTCRVGVVEPTGPDTMVFVKLNDREVVCRVRPDQAVNPGDTMPLAMDFSRAVFFDPETEKRVA